MAARTRPVGSTLSRPAVSSNRTLGLKELNDELHGSGYVILRTRVLPWALSSWVALIAGFLGPLIVFFSRRAKQDPFALLPMGLVIAGGIWVERYVLVVPALWKGPAAPLGIPELLISAGFASAAILSYLAFIRYFPILPWSDTTLDSSTSH